MGPSIKYVTLFLANLSPSPCHTLSHIPGPTPQSTSHISDLPRYFSKPSTKNPDKSPLYKFSLNCSRGFCPVGFVRESLVWKVLSGAVYINTSPASPASPAPDMCIWALLRRRKSVYKYFSGAENAFLNTSQASPAPERYQISNTSSVPEKYLNNTLLRRRRSLGRN